MILMLDNYDSFTYNVVHYLAELGADVEVVRNDQLSVEEAVAMEPDKLVISPGPCTPNEAGISVDLIKRLAGQIPILGICLGHQSIGQAFGGNIIRARRVMHGKVSPVCHIGSGVFAGIPSPYEATRYHSLVIDRETLPECLEITAWTEDESGKVDEIMGIRHREYAIEGVQFHPESILTQHGHKLLENFLKGAS